MSTNIHTTHTNGNVWQPRKSEKWICPSGQEVWTRQPGPEFTLRLGRMPQTFAGADNIPKRQEGQSDEEYGRQVLEHISDEDLVAVARELLVAMIVSPKLALNPKPELGEIGPDDVGTDFWPLYEYGMGKYFNQKGKVKVGDGEVEADNLESFREEPGVSGDGVDSVHVPIAEAESDISDPGLVHSTAT